MLFRSLDAVHDLLKRLGRVLDGASAFGMVAHAVHLEIHESGTVRVMMQSPNELNEPDTRWRGQGVVGPIVVRDRLEGLRKAGNDAARA